MIVETTLMQRCGDGTPMCSRQGKSTTFQYKAFSENKLKANKKLQINEQQNMDEDKKDNLDRVLEKLKVNIYRCIYLMNIIERGNGRVRRRRK